MQALRSFALPAAAIFFVGLAAPAALPAQILDLTGTWNLELEANLPGEVPPPPELAAGSATLAPKGGVPGPDCFYSGTVVASQDGDDWTGPAELTLVSGEAGCPAEMIGDLTGTLSEVGGTIFIDGFIDGGNPAGNATFSGTISPNPGGSGTMTVNQGSFDGTGGIWAAVLQQSALEIPELTPAGLAVLTLLLLAAGAWLLGRQASV
jgi:hypothetical protein